MSKYSQTNDSTGFAGAVMLAGLLMFFFMACATPNGEAGPGKTSALNTTFQTAPVAPNGVDAGRLVKALIAGCDGFQACIETSTRQLLSDTRIGEPDRTNIQMIVKSCRDSPINDKGHCQERALKKMYGE